MDGRKRWRYSLRCLLGALTLVCLFCALWIACRQRAISDVKTAARGWTPKIVVPFVLGVTKSDNVTVVTTYHVWCFGLVLDLPYSSEQPETRGFVSGGVRPRILIEEDEELPLQLSDF